MKFQKYFWIFALFLAIQGSTGTVQAQDSLNLNGKIFTNYLSRGEVVSHIIDGLDLRTQEKPLIDSCLHHINDCFFVFSAMSRFHLEFDPMVLYPDVPVAYRYYNDVNLATMLGLVHGYIDEQKTPFRPRASMRRIDALKVLLGAAHLVDWRERFELVASLGNEELLKAQKSSFEDVTALNPDMWWYSRYVNFALDKGIIEPSKLFRPDEYITDGELENMLTKVNEIIKSSKKLPAAPLTSAS